jgi:dihydrofolate synthase/folylpolyglutamate synthase
VGDPTIPIIEDRAEAEAFLDERIGHGVKPGLERITGLLEFMGDPHQTFPSIHVAGTNGKTTVSRMIQQILGAHGLATGGFTSPHLSTVEERFAVHGAPIDPDAFTDAVRDIAWFVVGFEQAAGTPVTYFEVTAALAFSIFADRAVDVAVVEVGLGGRLDATNVVDGAVCVITGIDIDHTEFLGSTIVEIAAEKAAIVKDDGVLVTGPLPEEALEVVARRVASTNARWKRTGEDFSVAAAVPGVGGWECMVDGVFDEYPDLFLPLHGHHQVDHLATAIAACEMFLGRALDPESLRLAVTSMSSPGRLEVVARRPVVIIDGAHNRQGFEGLAATLDGEFPPLGWQLVLGVRGERSVPDLVAPLAGHVTEVFATAADDPMSLPAAEVAEAAAATLGVPANVVGGVVAAVDAAREAAGPDGGVVVAGSLYVAGEAREAFDLPAERGVAAHLRFEVTDVDDGDEGIDGSEPSFSDRFDLDGYGEGDDGDDEQDRGRG